MKKILLFLILLLLAVNPQCFAQIKSSPNKSKLTLTIVPTSYAGGNSEETYISNHFHVLLTNTSEQPINLFEEWNSWGYFGLSFEITYPNGRKVQSKKADRGWDKNYASTVTIGPHGFYVFDVDFETDPQTGDVWENSILREPRIEHGIQCRMRAIYSIAKDEDAIRKHAWTGTISSPEGSYTIWP
jgi:hypothetical protein